MATARPTQTTWMDAPWRCLVRWLAIGAGLSLLAHCTYVGLYTIIDHLLGQEPVTFTHMCSSADDQLGAWTMAMIVSGRLKIPNRLEQRVLVAVLGAPIGGVIWSLSLRLSPVFSLLALGLALSVFIPECILRARLRI